MVSSRVRCFSRVTTLSRSTKLLFNDSKSALEVAELLLATNGALRGFEKVHYEYNATISEDFEIKKHGIFKEQCC